MAIALLNYFVLQRCLILVCQQYKAKMKNLLPTVLICFVLLLNACTKSASENITGKWHVVSDSMITNGAAISYNIYHGNILNYFIF